MSEELNIPCRVLLAGVPEDGFEGFEDYRKVAPGLQKGEEIEPGEDFDDGKIAFSCTLRVKKDPKTERPNFLGPYAFGTPQERHLYICWCGDREGTRTTFRRMKVPLKTVEWRQLEGVSHAEEEVLEAEVSARAKDGGPACASVPLLGSGWRIAKA